MISNERKGMLKGSKQRASNVPKKKYEINILIFFFGNIPNKNFITI